MSPREWLQRSWRLAVVVSRNELWLLRRNPLETVGLMLVVTGFLAVAFFGARALIPSLAHSGAAQTSWIVGSIVLMLVNQGYQRVGFALQTQQQTGTLEQSAMSPLGLPTVAIITFGGWMLLNLLPMIPLALGLMGVSGHWIRGDPATLVILFSCLVAGVLGIALLLGGLTLVYKRMTILTGMIALPVLALVALPVDHLPFLAFFPVSLPNAMLSRASTSGISLWQEPGWQVLVMLITTVVYLSAGVLVFRAMDRRARQLGVLGTY